MSPKALQCPACQRKTPLTSLGRDPTFRCAGCGRVLKVPAQLRPGASPAPRRDSDHTSQMPVSAPKPRAAPPPPSPPPRERARPAPPARRKVAFLLRVVAWVVAVPIGAVAVWMPARRTGFLSGQRLLDLLVGSGWGRYGRVLIIVPLWALVTSLIVQLLLLVFAKLRDRRRAIRAERARTATPQDDGRGHSKRRQQAPAPTRRQRARAPTR